MSMFIVKILTFLMEFKIKYYLSQTNVTIAKLIAARQTAKGLLFSPFFTAQHGYLFICLFISITEQTGITCDQNPVT